MRRSRIAATLVLGAVALASCSAEEAGPPPEPKCNGHEALCGRRYDQVSFATTHNAMSNAEAGWIAPNQNYGITRQLEDGVRGMMLDTYEEDDEILLCHQYCLAGSQPLVDGLEEIAIFLETNPGAVVSIIFEDDITHAQTASAFEESGLIDFVYAHDVAELWPTLSEMIEADTRLVAFQENLPQVPEFPWLMHIWEHAWDTPYSFSAPEDFVCDPNRGDPSNALFLVNHFLTAPLGGDPALADMVNHNPLFIDRARQCEDEGNALPNFVAVDFYDIGDLFDVVDSLNGL